MDAGIDYGRGIVNRDPETDIHFGTIPCNQVDFWWDNTEMDDPPYECVCGTVIPNPTDGMECPDCGEEIDFAFYEGPALHYVKDGVYFAYNGDDFDIIIERSPYFTLCSYASPCFRGGGYLPAVNTLGIKTYCLGPEWFEGKPPYPVFRVEDGTEVV